MQGHARVLRSSAHGLAPGEEHRSGIDRRREAGELRASGDCRHVFHNQLRDGWPLSSCPTVQYALGYRPDEGSWWKRFLTFDDLEVVSAYNTYRNLGLPPGPIASPGLDAIAAAAQPAETEFYFFMVDCTKEDGSHVFAANEAEHLANFDRCGGVITAP